MRKGRGVYGGLALASTVPFSLKLRGELAFSRHGEHALCLCLWSMEYGGEEDGALTENSFS
jgi:hypothetical protein